MIQKKFRLRGSKLFLTYPQCEIPLNSVKFQIIEKLSNFILEDYLLVYEDHDDQSVNIGKHIHAFFKFRKRLDIKNPNLLDILDINNQIYHGNYQSCRNELSTLNYLLKDVVDRSSILISDNLRSKVSQTGVIMSLHEALIQLAETGQVNEAMLLLRKEKPETYVKSHSHYEKSLRELSLKALGAVKKFDMSSFMYTEKMARSFHYSVLRNKTVYVLGKSGTGKSSFVETFLIEVMKKNPLIINNVDSLREFNKNIHSAIVLDDCNISKLDREQLIKLFEVEFESTHHLRYANVRIPAKIPKFFITNKKLIDLVKCKEYASDDAITRRLHVVEVNENVYKVQEKDENDNM